MVRKNKILSGSAKLKGGLLPTVAKMAIASKSGICLTLPKDVEPARYYFNEEIGVVIECKSSDNAEIIALANGKGLHTQYVGDVCNDSKYFEFYDSTKKYSINSYDVFKWFSETGNQIKKHLGISQKVELESLPRMVPRLSFDPRFANDTGGRKGKIFKVAILAAPGTNGHHELAYMFGRMKRKFSVQVIQMGELISGKYDLKDFSVIAFAGGFSYRDVGGSGKGWAASILFNEKLKKMFDDFFLRPDTLSFGVCNGFQVATLLGVLDESLWQKPRLLHNESGLFEHRPVNLLIPKNTRSIMFRGMEGSVLPAWSAHGEGKLFLPKGDYASIKSDGFVTVCYADASGLSTEGYPYNPNGSDNGIAGLCTKDGRHTFMMPHIERVSATNDHLPFKPENWKFKTPVWHKAFVNMYIWLYDNVKS